MNKIKVSKDFFLHEFQCKDGSNLVKLHSKLLEKLQELRDTVGLPFNINSAYRTPEHNKAVGGTSNSEHTKGTAVDVSMRNQKISIEEMRDLAEKVGFTGIGLYDTFIHLDIRNKKSRWDYRTVKNINLTYNRALKQGMKGNDVKALQQRLLDLGFNPNGIDGSFGGGTKRAVLDFQRYAKIQVDGSVGRQTVSALNNAKKKVDKLPTKLIKRYGTNIYVKEVPKEYFVDVDLGVRGKLEILSKIVNDKLKQGKKVLGGINLGFYNFNGSSEHLGMLIDEGLYYSPPSKSFIDFIYNKDGTTEIINLHGYDAKTLVGFQRNAHWAVGTSYSLVQKGKINLENSNNFAHSKNREPRAMFGNKSNGNFILAVADGRQKGSLGLTATQQANVMLELGCYNAVNGDGGGSATMVEVENGKAKVVNKPSNSGGKERPIGSVLLVYEDR